MIPLGCLQLSCVRRIRRRSWICRSLGCVGVCGGVGVRGCVWVYVVVCGCGCVWVCVWVCQSPRLALQKHMEKHVAAPSLENSGLNLTNSQLSSPPRCQSSLTSVQSEVLQHMAPGRKKSLSKLPAKKKISSPQLGIKHIVLCVIVLLGYILDLTQPLF